MKSASPTPPLVLIAGASAEAAPEPALPRPERPAREDPPMPASRLAFPSLGRLLGAAAGALALLGAPAAAQSLIRDAEIERTLDRLAAPVLEAAGLSPGRVEILIAEDPSLNAFVATPQAMVLHSGLLSRFERPETLIGVIAHEAGHIAGGHLQRRAIAARQLQGPAAVAMALAIAAGAAGGGEAAAALAIGGPEAARRSFLSHTRAEEAAADQAALDAMTGAGIDPDGMLDILRSFAGQEVFLSDRLDPYAVTHPLSSERIALLERRVAAASTRGARLDPELAYWHDRMQTKLDAFLERPERVLARLEREDPEAETTLYARAIALHRMARTEEALAELERLLRRRPDDPFFWELRGQILLEAGRADEAVEPLRRAVALAPDEPLIRGLLGRALLGAGDPREALETLERAARDDPGDARVLRDLAYAYARAGRDGDAALATAERLAVAGAFQEAHRQARRAQDLLPEGSPGWLRADDIALAAERAAR